MWTAILKDGKKASETTHKWSDIKNDIKVLSYIFDGSTVNLPTSNEYIQYKTGSASLLGGEILVESQTIGCKIGESKLLLRFNFKSKKIDVLIE